MKKLALFSFAALATAGLFAEVTITGVSARQRWPWNNLVDVDFTIGGAAQGEVFAISVSGTTVTPNGTATLHAKTFTTEPIAKDGANRVVWDFGADYPDTKVDDLSVTVTATPYSDAMPVYLVVDVSGGASASSYPVRYTTTAPVHTVGQNDPCKTTEIWLRRVKDGGPATMGNGDGSGTYRFYPNHYVTLTKDYYLGIFPLTGDQVRNITTADYQYFTNETYRATRPADNISWNQARGKNTRMDSAPTAASLLGVIRARSGLDFDLQTEWQWEYAMRAGSTSATPSCFIRSLPRARTDGRNSTEDEGSFYVDRSGPNPWGFYLTIGNIWAFI